MKVLVKYNDGTGVVKKDIIDGVTNLKIVDNGYLYLTNIAKIKAIYSNFISATEYEENK